MSSRDIEAIPEGVPCDTQFAIPRGLCYQSTGHSQYGLAMIYSSQEPDDYAMGDGSLAYRSGQRVQPSDQTRSGGVSPPCPVLVKLQPARTNLMTASLPQGSDSRAPLRTSRSKLTVSRLLPADDSSQSWQRSRRWPRPE